MRYREDRSGRVHRLGDVLRELFALKGLNRVGVGRAVEAAWAEVAGEEVASRTRVGRLRRGVLEIVVQDSSLLHELVAFRKAELLRNLQRRLGGRVRELRFRSGA